MSADSPERGVYVLGTDKAENLGPIYEALRATGYAWCGQALSLNEGLRQLELIKDKVHLVVVRAELARRGEEAALLDPVARWPLIVLVGAARADRQADLACFPNVQAVLSVPPYNFSGVRKMVQKVAVPPATSVVTAQPAPAHVDAPIVAEVIKSSGTTQSTPIVATQRPVVSRLRLAFYGSRGGVGTSTAALQAAQLLVGCGMKVALFDVRQRGDLHLMLGEQPSAQPLQKASLMLYLGEPTEETACQYEAIIIDGGRQRGTFNAQWIEVQRPFDEAMLRRFTGLPPAEQSGAARPTRRMSLPKLLAIEITE